MDMLMVIWDALQDMLLDESAIEPQRGEPGEPGYLEPERIEEQWRRMKKAINNERAGKIRRSRSSRWRGG